MTQIAGRHPNVRTYGLCQKRSAIILITGLQQPNYRRPNAIDNRPQIERLISHRLLQLVQYHLDGATLSVAKYPTTNGVPNILRRIQRYQFAMEKLRFRQPG